MSEQRISRAELQERTEAALQAEWERYAERLPADALSWANGAAYIRESSADSMVSDAPITQLVSTLALLAAKQIYVPWEQVFFENASASELESRRVFRGVLERAESGEFATIGAYVSNRLFRNAEEASAVKRTLRKKGVELMWSGKPQFDPRDPLGWNLERSTDLADELHSRQTSWLVGRAYEAKTRRGEPTPRLSEVWNPVEWAPGLRGGRAGRPIRWELVEPLAGYLRAGVRRYIDGASLQGLADWAWKNGLKTPKGRPLDVQWWHRHLRDPKIAGYLPVTEYMGYKPGKESPAPPPRSERELVPCVLPAVISWQDFTTVKRVMQERRRNPSQRHAYRAHLLGSGIGHDAGCGHKMHVHDQRGGSVSMKCSATAEGDRHGKAFRVDEASEQLDHLVGSLKFDEALLAEIEVELARLAEPEPAVRKPVSPEEEQLRSALADLQDAQFSDLRASIEERLKRLEAPTPTSIDTPVRRFAASVDDLRRWAEIWATAGAERKNELLRAAGVRAYIERIEPPMTRKRRSTPTAKRRLQRNPPFSRLVRVEAEVPEFALALAAAAECGDHVSSTTDAKAIPALAQPLIRLPLDLEAALERARKASPGLAEAA